MDHFVPATGRVLRYWYAALTTHCRHRLYIYLNVQPVPPAKKGESARREWTNSEVWQRPGPQQKEPAPEVRVSPVQAGKEIPRLTRRIRVDEQRRSRPAAARRPGAALGTTFDYTRSRLRRMRADAGKIAF